MINEVQAKLIIKKAEQSIEIVRLLRKDKAIGEIARELNCDRQLVEYYKKRLLKENV